MRLEIIKDFINPETIQECVNWFDESVASGKNLMPGMTRNNQLGYTKRLTSRANEGVQYPLLFRQIQAKIKRHWKFSSEVQKVKNNTGIICVATLPGGDTYLHIDPRNEDNRHPVTCNILVQDAEGGGELILNGEKVEYGVGDLVCYSPSRYPHEVTPTTGSKNRYQMIFRFMDDIWEYEGADL